MNRSDENLKQFEDPLYAGLKNTRPEKQKVEEIKVNSASPRGSNYTLLIILLTVTALGVVGFFVFRSQQQIELLTQELTASKTQLGLVSEDLKLSQEELGSLTHGLRESQTQISTQSQEINRYKGLYQNLRNDQQEQNRELAALNVQKADQSEVNQLKGETSELKSTATELRTQLESTSGQVEELNQRSLAHQTDIETNRSEIQEVRVSSQENTSGLAELKRSLEREYYNFELQEKGGYMKVFEVSLSLKDTDNTRKQFDMYLLANGKVIRKNDHSINEPITFYVDGTQKPYEVVVTRVDDKMVVGYLSVPKS